jgi:CRP-like cAMP-binding protein
MISETFLKEVSLFKSLNEAERRHMCGLLKEEFFREGEVILEEGRIGSTLYIIWTGKVRVSRNFDRESFVLTELGPYDFFGEMSLIDDCPISATVTAISDTTFFTMTRENFRVLTSESTVLTSRVWESIARVLTARIRKTGDLVKMYYGLNKALCENEEFRQLFTSWNFHTSKSQL